ncbi:hypothetical protein SLEP1_g6061, partial [Rubroshorea leprosula]
MLAAFTDRELLVLDPEGRVQEAEGTWVLMDFLVSHGDEVINDIEAILGTVSSSSPLLYSPLSMVLSSWFNTQFGPSSSTPKSSASLDSLFSRPKKSISYHINRYSR